MNRTHPNFNKPDEESSDTLSTNLPYSSYNSFGTVSPPLTGSPVHDNDSVSDNSKKIRKKRNTYQKIDDGTRMKLLDAVQQGETLKAAAKRYGINYSSAKSILHTYRKEGRILKKSAQERIARKRTKTSSDLEMSPIYPYKEYQGFDCAPENQVYGSMDFQQRIDLPIINCLGDEGHMRTVAPNGMTINSLGDFKIDSEGRNKSENNNLTSSIAIKLDSQSYQAIPSHINNNVPNSIPMLNPAVQNSRNIQSGSWQLNVNVRSDNSQKNSVKPVVNAREEPRFTYNFNTTRAPEHHKDPEPCYMNYSNAGPQVHQTRPRREVPAEYDPSYLNRRYDGVNDMINTNVVNEEHYPSEGQNYDVSCFLNSSSPAYTFQPRANEIDYNQMGGMQGYPGAASLRGYCGEKGAGKRKGKRAMSMFILSALPAKSLNTN